MEQSVAKLQQHSLDTIAETPNAMRMSNSAFKETTSSEEETQTAPKQQRMYARNANGVVKRERTGKIKQDLLDELIV